MADMCSIYIYIYIYIDVLTYEYIYICYDLCLSGHTECAVDHEQFERCLRALLVLRDAVASTECKGTGMKDSGHFITLQTCSNCLCTGIFMLKFSNNPTSPALFFEHHALYNAYLNEAFSCPMNFQFSALLTK